MIIRKAVIRDLDEIFSLSESWMANEGHPAYLTFTKQWIKNNIVKGNILVAVDKGLIIGHTLGSVYKAKKKCYYGLNKGDDYFLLDSLYVKPDYRNKNVGTLLLKRVEKQALKKGVVFIRLSALSKNIIKTVSFYLKNNYGAESIRLYKRLKH